VPDFLLVFVCTGNRFRSPLAAAHVRALTAGLRVRVESMGTLDLGPVPALPEALDYGSRAGLDLSRHRARPLVPDLLAAADLVLGFEEMHIWDAVMDGGARRAQTFTLPEFVALLQREPDAVNGSTDIVEHARRAIARAHTARQPFRTAKRLEMRDPLGAGPAAFSEAAAEIGMLTQELTARLFAPDA
jgi:low molecular weight protein-tyrosine phosphatase